MLHLSFKQTKEEMMVRAAATLLFAAIKRKGFPLVPLSEITEHPQYGFTASASTAPVGPKFVRITDLQAGRIDWDNVPYCKCDDPENYLLKGGDILFARTGATTGKTHLLKTAENAVFASYLIRLRASARVIPQYLYSFFQGDLYWSQIVEEKEGSAQPNVNGRKLWEIELPLVAPAIQLAVSNFIEVVWARQHGSAEDLPKLPDPIAEQRRIVARIEELSAKIEEAKKLREKATSEAEVLTQAVRNQIFERYLRASPLKTLDSVLTVVRGSSPRPKGDARYYGGPVPRLLIADITRDGRYVTPSIDSLTDAGALLSRPMPRGSLVLAISGSYGVPAFLAVDACIHDGFIGFRNLSREVDPEFLYQVMLWRRPYFDSVVKNSGLQNLTTAHLKKMTVPVPALRDQGLIVGRLDNLQAKIDSARKSQQETAAGLNALLPSILSRAFSGEL